MAEKVSTFAIRLRDGLSMRDMTQAELSRQSGVDKSSISRYLKNEYKGNQDAVYRIAHALRVDEAWLMGYDVPMERDTSAVAAPAISPNLEPYYPKEQMPILGRVAAGLPMYAEDNIIGYAANDFADGESYYALVVHGDSMTAAGIDDGDLVVVRQQSAVDDGQIAVVLINGDDATIKYVRQQGNMVILMPKSYNPQHQPQIYNMEETPVQVIGRVVQIRKSV